MKLSFRNLRTSVQRLSTQYPLLIISLMILLILSLDAIWSRDIISTVMSDDKHAALIILIIISIIVGVSIYGRSYKYNSVLHIAIIL
jgi:hypothetical protein